MRFADYSDPVTAPQLDSALRQGGFQGVTHYLGGTPGYVLRVEDPALVTAIRNVGWQQAGIFVWRTPADVRGDHDVFVVRSVYGIQGWFRVFLDIEPGAFDADPAGWPPAADAWCDALRAAGLSPGIYGVDRTCAACANHADVIWRAVPGMCDPAAAGPQGLSPAFMPGRRAVQCGSEVWNGIDFDVSVSQFSFLEDAMTRGERIAFFRMWMFATGRPPQLVPNDPQNRWDDQYWADHAADLIAQLGDETGWAKAVDDFRADYAVDGGVYPGHPGPKGDVGPPGPPGPPAPPHHHDFAGTSGPPA